MRRLAFLALLAILPGCRPKAADGMTVTTEEFGRLVWLAGRWIGTGSDSTIFHESYAFIDDSTIRSYTWADTGYTQVKDSSELALRHGGVSSRSGDFRWVLTSWDRFGLRFEPRAKAANTFLWRYVDDYTWVATLRWTGQDGKQQEKVYTMRRWQL
jgi:hypothetical protein